jgi:hypothetical protein
VITPDTEIKPLSEASSLEEFKELRKAAATAGTGEEPAKPTQVEETTPAQSATEAGTVETKVQEPPVEKSADDQIKELRAKGKHAAANKLMVESAVKAEREENARLKQEMETLRSRPSERPAQAPAPTQQASDSKAPDATDAKYAGPKGYEEYLLDMADYRFEAKQQAQRAAQSRGAAAQAVGAKVAAAKGKYADFDTVTAGNWDAKTNTGSGLWLTPAMIQFVQESDNAMDVLYHLGKNMAEHARIVALSPSMQLVQLGQLSHLISAPPANTTPEKRVPAVSKVAPPPRVLSGHDAPPPKPLSEATSYEEHKRLRKLQRGAA